MVSQAVIPLWIRSCPSKISAEISAIIFGSLYLAILAQFSIPLPFSPVPITGQTFGVATLSLLSGRKRAFTAFGLYLTEGAFGFPVFAGLSSKLIFGPTAGYLLGMWLATFIVGDLADKGFAKTFRNAFLSCVCGSCCVFICGVIGLSFFIPSSHLLAAGIFPFLPGDLIKNTLAATLVTSLARVHAAQKN